MKYFVDRQQHVWMVGDTYSCSFRQTDYAVVKCHVTSCLISKTFFCLVNKTVVKQLLEQLRGPECPIYLVGCTYQPDGSVSGQNLPSHHGPAKHHEECGRLEAVLCPHRFLVLPRGGRKSRRLI